MLASRNLPFLDMLAQSGLLTAQEVEEVLAVCPETVNSGEELARFFVAEGRLTPFQTWQLLQGRWRGLVMGSFHILGPISRAGMGRVFLAQSKPEGRKVAIKLVRAEGADAEAATARLRLEAFASLTLDHPNIVRGLEYDRIANAKRETYYLAMEFVPGPNLAELRSMQRSLPWRQACGFAEQAARGLHAAHEAGFVHRDVKPSNLLVTHQGQVKLLDFGLAQYSGPERSYHTTPGKRLGTPDYISPEQTRNGEAVDRRADVYGLGCTLYFLLTGSAPFPTAEVKDKLRGHRQEEPAALRTLAPEAPPEVARLVERLMAKSPKDRPRNMQEVVDALRPFSEIGPVEFDYPALLRARARLWQGPPEPSAPPQAAEPAAAAKLAQPGEPDPLDRLRQKIDTLAAELSRSQGVERDLREQLRQQQERAVLQQQEHDLLVEMMREELEAARRAQGETLQEADRQRSEIASLQQQLGSLQVQHDDLARQVWERTNESEQQMERLRELQDQLVTTEQARDRLQSALDRERETHRRAAAAREAAELRLAQYRSRVQNVAAEIERMTAGLNHQEDDDLDLDGYDLARQEPSASEPLPNLLPDDDLLPRTAPRRG